MNSDQLLRRADTAFDRADVAALEALRRALPAGRMVKWQHGDHWRLGEVVEILGFRYHHASVRVKSAATRKIYDVPAGTILRTLPK